jgi:hypothetical protein
VYHGGQILNTSSGVGYDIRAACTFFADETINIRDLKRQIHTGLELLPSQLVHGSTLHQQVRVFFFYRLFGVVYDEIWGMIKITAPY